MELRLEWPHWRLGENNFLNRRTSEFRVYSRFLSFLWNREEEEDNGSDDNGGSKTIILGLLHAGHTVSILERFHKPHIVATLKVWLIPDSYSKWLYRPCSVCTMTLSTYYSQIQSYHSLPFLFTCLSVHPVMSQLQSSETHEIFHFSEQQGIIDVWKLSYYTVTLKSL